MNRTEYIKELLEKFERRQCSPEEIAELHAWLDEQALAGKEYAFSGEEELGSMRNTLRSAILEGMGQRSVKKGWIRYVTLAAALAAGVWACYWLLGSLLHKRGEIILTAARGKVEKRSLPDGSTVWLNDNSELVYHGSFADDRTIELKRGEAFFEVKKDPAHVFAVVTGGLRTTVLGTSFSTRLGLEGNLKISVVTGKVMIGKQDGSIQKDTLGFLLPYQRLRYNTGTGKATIDSVLAGEADGWTRGDLFLQNASLEEVIAWLQDHFDVTIQNKRTTYTGEYYLQVKRDIPLTEVLHILNLLGKKDHVQFSLQGKTIVIQ